MDTASIAGSTSASGLRRGLLALRARQWAHFVGLPLLGLEVTELDEAATLIRLAIVLVVAAATLGFAYGLNAINERATDMSPAKNPLVGAAALAPSEWWPTVASAVTALVGAAALGVTAFSAVSSSLIAGWLYSAGPRLKHRPVVGLVMDLLIFAPLAFLAVADPAALPKGFNLLFLSFIVLLTQNQLIHECGDVEEDRAAGAVTTAVWLGTERSSKLVASIGASGAIAAWLMGETLTAKLAAVAVIAAATVVATMGRAEPAAARVRHRHVCALGGAGLYLLVRVEGVL